MEAKNKINDVKNRFLFISPSVEAGLERESQITDFEIMSLLGSGSFGKVYLCKHKETNAVYAIKSIDKTNKNNDLGAPYFRREIEIMYKINHPNIVKLYGHFEDNQACYFLMEYIPKGNLYSLLSKQKSKCFDTAKVANFMKDLISAVYYIHNMNPPIVHRDIKPENLLVGEDGRVKLTDFGWSNYIEYFTIRSTFCGTPLYLAPEVIKQTGHDKSVDIWCIGALIFELLTGKCPFNGSSDAVLYDNILKNKIDWPKDINLEAKNLISRILKTDPKDRISLNDMLKHPFFTNHVDNSEEYLVKPSELNGNDEKGIYIISKDTPQTISRLMKKDNIIKDIANLNLNNERSPAYQPNTVPNTNQNSNINNNIIEVSPNSNSQNYNYYPSEDLLNEFKKLQNQVLDSNKKINNLHKENEELKLKEKVFALEKEGLIKEKEEQESEKLALQMEYAQVKYKIFEYDEKMKNMINIVKSHEQQIERDRNYINNINEKNESLKKSKEDVTNFYLKKIDFLEQALKEANSEKEIQIKNDISLVRQSIKILKEDKNKNEKHGEKGKDKDKNELGFNDNPMDFNFLATLEMLQKDFDDERKKYNIIIQNKQDEISRLKCENNNLIQNENIQNKNLIEQYKHDLLMKENEINFLNSKLKRLEELFKVNNNKV